VLAVLHLSALALHSVLNCACDDWRHCREQAATRRCSGGSRCFGGKLRALKQIWTASQIGPLCSPSMCGQRQLVGYAAPLQGFAIEPVIVGIVRSAIRAARLIQRFPAVNDANGRASLPNGAAVDAR